MSAAPDPDEAFGKLSHIGFATFGGLMLLDRLRFSLLSRLLLRQNLELLN